MTKSTTKARETIQKSKMSVSDATRETAIIEILKHKMDEGKNLVTHYLRTYAIYVAINGALFKFALDTNSTEKLKLLLSWIGFSLAVSGILICRWGLKQQQLIRNDIESLYELLAISLVPDQVKPILYVTYAAIITVVLLLVAWVYIIVSSVL